MNGIIRLGIFGLWFLLCFQVTQVHAEEEHVASASRLCSSQLSHLVSLPRVSEDRFEAEPPSTQAVSGTVWVPVFSLQTPSARGGSPVESELRISNSRLESVSDPQRIELTSPAADLDMTRISAVESELYERFFLIKEAVNKLRPPSEGVNVQVYRQGIASVVARAFSESVSEKRVTEGHYLAYAEALHRRVEEGNPEVLGLAALKALATEVAHTSAARSFRENHPRPQEAIDRWHEYQAQAIPMEGLEAVEMRNRLGADLLRGFRGGSKVGFRLPSSPGFLYFVFMPQLMNASQLLGGDRMIVPELAVQEELLAIEGIRHLPYFVYRLDDRIILVQEEVEPVVDLEGLPKSEYESVIQLLREKIEPNRQKGKTIRERVGGSRHYRNLIPLEGYLNDKTGAKPKSRVDTGLDVGLIRHKNGKIEAVGVGIHPITREAYLYDW